MIRSIQEVYQYIHSLPPKKVAVAQAADSHVLQAVSAAYAEGYALPVLVGDKARICATAEAEHIDIMPFEIVPADSDEEAAAKAVQMVHEGQADVVMKGLMDSSMFLRAVLNKEYGLRKSGASMSAIAVVELRKLGRLVFITDPGITPAPDMAAKINITKNAVDIAHRFGIETPVVAALSAAEKLNKNMVSSVEAAELAAMSERGELGQCHVMGPISLDLALSAEAAEEKGYRHLCAGQADIVLVPTIEVGNALYKSLMLFADMQTGGIMAGTAAPVVFCSRADSAETKKNTLAMALYLASRKEVGA